MEVEVITVVGEGLTSIQNNPDFKFFPLSFIFPERIRTNSILFVGINPSGQSTDVSMNKYELKQQGNSHPYFKKFEDISNYCDLEWTHLDLLYFRETDQSKIGTILREKNGLDFIWKQLEISKLLLEKCEPRIVVVCNALAGTFLGKDRSGDNNKWLDLDLKFDTEIGTYKWNNRIPIFFSGMLTGQRALDNGSYERLKWQIKRAINYNSTT